MTRIGVLSDTHGLLDKRVFEHFKDVDENVSLVKEYFDSKRRLWNDEHQNIKIAGFQVELYVQDIHERRHRSDYHRGHGRTAPRDHRRQTAS